MSFREEPNRPGHLARTFWPSRYKTFNHRPGKCFKFWTDTFWEMHNKVEPEPEYLQLTPPPSPHTGDSPTLIESSESSDERDEADEVVHQSAISIQDVSVFRLFVLAKSMFLFRLRNPTADPIELD